ncbi:hypothetical protein AMTR_s00008p00268620, partial [Amborella trichopoda]
MESSPEKSPENLSSGVPGSRGGDLGFQTCARPVREGVRLSQQRKLNGFLLCNDNAEAEYEKKVSNTWKRDPTSTKKTLDEGVIDLNAEPGNFSINIGKETLNDCCIADSSTDKEMLVSFNESNKSGSDFFTKVSKKRKQRNQQNKFPNDYNGTPIGKKKCRRLKEQKIEPDSTSNGAKRNSSKRKLTRDKFENAIDLGTQSQSNAPTLVCDLWMEAKMAAEENARLFAGRKTHPFFTCQKPIKRSLIYKEAVEVGTKDITLPQDEEIMPYPPVHINGTKQDEYFLLDWKKWNFLEQPFLNSIGRHHIALENSCSSVFEGSVEPLNFDKIPSSSNFQRILFPQKEVPFYQLHDAEGDHLVLSTEDPSVSKEAKVTYDQVVDHSISMEGNENLDQLLGYLHAVSGCVDSRWSTGNEPCEEFLHERMASYYLRCKNGRSSCSLWTDKYQPESASEVCGNSESVRFLNQWLNCWRGWDRETYKGPTKDYRCHIYDDDYSCFEEDFDVGSLDKETILKNVMLLTGPVGSGKSAAIYACAKEQGFEVIEVSASDWRNGSLVKQKFGEAVESHRLHKRSVEDLRYSPNKLRTSSSQDILRNDGNGAPKVEAKVHEFKTGMDATRNEMEGPEENREIRSSSGQTGKKSLILFEDVDTIFNEDRGFLAAILQLAETAKRPIILTSNRKDPHLPLLLNKLTINFMLPSLVELLCHVYMICVAEGAKVLPHLINHSIRCCHGDIRGTIMLLQFWCQGKKSFQYERMLTSTYRPLPFDLDAGYHILPKVIPWGFPCPLSTMVHEEISHTLSLVKENVWNIEEVLAIKVTLKGKLNASVNFSDEKEVIDAKKEVLLNRNFSDNEGNELFSTQSDDFDGLSKAVGTPTKSIQLPRDCRRRAMVTSDSEDGSLSDQPPLETPKRDTCNEWVQDPFNGSFSRRSALGIGTLSSPDSKQNQKTDKFDPRRLKRLKRVRDLDMCTLTASKEISCFPESSFILGARIDNVDDSLCSPSVAVTLEGISHCLEELENLQETNNPDNYEIELDRVSETVFGDTCEAAINSVTSNAVLDKSKMEPIETINGAYPLMDECSRVDFNICNMARDSSHPDATLSVLETWKKLRSHKEDLKSHLSSEVQALSRVIDSTLELIDLFSATDVLLTTCQLVCSDFLTPCEELDIMSWYDQRLEMASTLSHHGICFYAKESAVMGSELGYETKTDLASEMLAASSDTAAFGKLITRQTINTSAERDPSIQASKMDILSERESLQSRLSDCLLSLVPARTILSVKGAQFHEYSSFLGQIANSEVARLSQGNFKRRSARRSRNYLTTRPYKLSSEDVHLLAQYGGFGKVKGLSIER